MTLLVGNKLKLLKKWNLFKTRYIKVFGVNNSSITVDDIIAFMNEFLEDGGKVTEEEEKEDIPLSEKERISELSKALMVKYGTTREMKDRLKNYNLEHRDGDNDYFQGITSDRRDNIAKQVARQIIIHNKTNDEVGFGIKTEKIPEKVTFGKLVLLLLKIRL